LVCLDLRKKQKNKKIGNPYKIGRFDKIRGFDKLGKLGVLEKMGSLTPSYFFIVRDSQ
jgi:hypothetical protein|tara:strand:+ start:39 stop:212 length:174 start_codon:yes stop_codon:yes gene_type:complete